MRIVLIEEIIGLLGVSLLTLCLFISLIEERKRFLCSCAQASMGIFRKMIASGMKAPHKIIGYIVLTGYIIAVFSTAILITHNSPINITNSSFSDIGVNQTTVTGVNNTTLSLGVTYQNQTLPLRSQTDVILGKFMPSLWLDAALFVAGLFFVIYASRGFICFMSAVFQFFVDSENLPDQPTRSVIAILFTSVAVFIYHWVGLKLIFSYSLPILVLTEEAILQFENASPNDFSQWFLMLVAVQGIFITGIGIVWTLPTLEHDEPDALKVHLENWRQFGTWSATLLGGVLLTTGIVFIADISKFGGAFVWYITSLIGGGLALIIGSILFKMKKIEQDIIRNIDSKNECQD